MRGLIFRGKQIWVVLILGAITLTALVVFGSMKTASSTASSASLSTFTARRDDLTITVTESGSINARNTIDIKCEVEAGRMGGGAGGGGGVTILSIVPEGSYVTPEDVNDGKVLVELDSSVLKEQIEQYKIEVATANAAYTEANEANLIQVKQNESDITASELAVKFALMDFQKYLGETVSKKVIEDMKRDPNATSDMASLIGDPNLGGNAQQMLDQLKDSIFLAMGRLTRGDKELQSTEKLFDANYAPEIEVMEKTLDVNSFKIQLTQAETELELFKLYTFPKEAEKYLSDYEEAKRELDRTQARARSMLAQTEAKLLSAKARFELQDERLKKQERQIGACTIRAPAPGLVVYASSSDFFMRRGGGSSRTIDEGETVFERQKIITLPDTADMIAEIAVHEAEVDKVRPGQSAEITVDPFPDQTFQGRVIKVAQLPDPRRGFFNPDLKVYTTQVSIDGTHDFLKPGMSAKVEILVEQLDDVVIVPVQVVANRRGRKVCFVATPEGPKEREVQTGAFNDTFVQIVDGLQEGEEVLLNPPRVTEAGDEYKSKQRPKGPQGGEQPRDGESPEGRRPQQGGGAPQGGRPSQAGGAPEGGRPPQGMQFELTDEMTDRIMSGLAKMDPEKAKELEQLRKSDPEKFKAELMKTMQGMRDRMMKQGRNREGRARNAESGQSRQVRD
jgi:multidrug resistance efflux pump